MKSHKQIPKLDSKQFTLLAKTLKIQLDWDTFHLVVKQHIYDILFEQLGESIEQEMQRYHA